MISLRRSSNSDGFAIIGVVVVVVLLVAVGGIGYYVYQRSSNDSAKQLKTSSDATKVEEQVYNQEDDLNKDLGSDNAKLDATKEEVQ